MPERVEAPTVGLDQAPGTLVQPCPLAKTKPHWIEVQLLDEHGHPVADEPYRIRLADGNLHEGTLNAQGLVRFDGIDPGTCFVWWPTLQGIVSPPLQPKAAPLGGLEAAHGHASINGHDMADETEKNHWIEIQLQDETGAPMDAACYELTMPDGTVERNILDENGRTFVDGMAAGICELTFPALTQGSWEAVGKQ